MLQLNFNTKTCIKQLLITTFNSIFIILSILTILKFKLNEKLNHIIFVFYITVLILLTLINIISIYTCIIYLKKYDEILDMNCLINIHENISINKIKLKQLLYILFFIFDLVLGIIFYASGVIYNLNVIHLLFIIAITSGPFLLAASMIMAGIIGICVALNEYCDYLSNGNIYNDENTNNNLRINRRNNSNTYNINIIVPMQPGMIASQNMISISTPREKNCSICLDDESENIEWVKLICNHKFHKSCVIKWLQTKSNCPLCREEILNLV